MSYHLQIDEEKNIVMITVNGYQADYLNNTIFITHILLYYRILI
jgi:hypothetical protein